MLDKKIYFQYQLGHLSELDDKEQELIANAKKSLNTAYAPYSGFMVGAAVLSTQGLDFISSMLDDLFDRIGN